MTQQPKNIAQLISREIIQELALPSNRRYGQAIYNRHGVEFIEREAAKLEAWAGGLSGSVTEGGGQRRRVQLRSTAKGLAWHCTGNPKHHQIFCKHCVAVALAFLG